ncbi:MAG: UDP-N-acetylmuramoyl-L-alanyl-D-glutamate--2,6-diaminopimelate ligase [Lachnospiraceae bacterium]
MAGLLKRLLADIDYSVIKGNEEINVEHLVTDSRKVSKGDVFVCIKGANFDGHRFAADVAKKGASAIILERDILCDEIPEGVTLIKTDNTKKALGYMSAAYFNYPASKLKTIGITGTKGKTTTAYMVREVLERSGIKTGLIGTIETIIGDEHIPAVNTTPDAYTIQETFDKMVKSGIEAVVMEVSSQGLMLHRVSGFIFDYGVFTNLGKDHIGENEHRDFNDYMMCKARLFKQCRHGIINIDDKHAKDMTEGALCDIETFGMSEGADFRAQDIQLYTEPGILGISYNLTVRDKERYSLKIDIPGRFNVYNSLTAIAVCSHFINDMKLMESVLAGIRIRGRAEIVKVSDDFTVMIDYAHNAMSLESILKSLREYNPKRIITLFGCGGNRDRSRRFEMGEVSAGLSDFTVITSDNPRHENPEDIIKDIITGVERGGGSYKAVADRAQAVKYAISIGQKGDVIVLAGKGHEDYQIIGDKKYHMDDKELVESAARELKIQ